MSFELVKLIDPIRMTIAGTFTPKGAYNAGTDYAVGDQVDYNGSSYIMYNDGPAGTVPTNTSYWGLLASKGTSGGTLAADTDGALTANSDSFIATQKATKTYADTKVSKTTTVNGHALSSNVTVTASDVSAVPTPSTALADGQYYGADASGNTVPYYNRIAYSDNGTNVALVLTNGTLQQIMGCAIVIPAGTQPVTIWAGFDVQITVAGSGAIVGAIMESTSGTAVAKKTYSYPGGFLTSTNAKFITIPTFFYNAGPSATDRVFGLYAETLVDATLTASVRNSATGRSWIMAVGG